MRTLLTIVCTLYFTASFAQLTTNRMFPAFSGETLSDKQVTIPEANPERETLVLIAYTAEAQKDAKNWVKQTYSNFLDPNGMGAGLYDVNVYYVYMFGGVKKAAFGKIKKRVKPETDVDLYDNVVLAESNGGWYKENLNFKDKNQPNIYLIGKSGKVIWHDYGRYTSEKMSELEDVLGRQ